MENSDNNQFTKCNRRTVQASTTLSRRYARRPGAKDDLTVTIQRSPRITRFQIEQPEYQPVSVLAEPVAELIDDGMDSLMFDAFSEVTPESSEQDHLMQDFLTQDPLTQESLAQDLLAQPENSVSAAPIDWTHKVAPHQEVARKEVAPPMTAEIANAVNIPISRTSEVSSQQIARQVVAHPLQTSANSAMRRRSIKVQDMDAPKVSAKELKEQAIRRAMLAASQTESKDSKHQTSSKKSRKTKKVQTMHFGFGRVMLALGCAVAAVVAIVYFVNMNAPDISLRVAAMQTGMDPSYPTYVPRNYSVSGITSKDGEIKIDFVNSVDNKKFSLTEEKSSWDTNALLANFVKSEYGSDYSTVKEQGLTIYISDSNAAWVNGGIVYKIEATGDTLTNKQIKSIATSL